MITAELFYPKTFWLFRKTPFSKNAFDKTVATDQEKTHFNRIRCPLCEWQPRHSDRWMCVDGGHPEYFYNACYTSWNTFETGGRCPGCNHQWRWTTCLRCHNFSLHEDWYTDEAD